MAAPVPRLANAVLGVGLSAFIGGIYWYSMKSVADVRVRAGVRQPLPCVVYPVLWQCSRHARAVGSYGPT